MQLDKYAILGYPLAHSKSPLIHNHAFRQLDISAQYEKLEIVPREFEEQIPIIKDQNWAGFNVTNPFKQRIIPFLDRLSEEAHKIGAVNTIRVSKEGKWIGFNTDYYGFIQPLRQRAEEFNSILILGAGGAARSVLLACLQELTPKKLVVANRTVKKAEHLLDAFHEVIRPGLMTVASSPESIPVQEYDLIVNCTSVGMGESISKVPLNPAGLGSSKCLVYDLIYNPPATLFLEKAQAEGYQVLNGLPMLVYQARKAFEIWTGRGFEVSEMMHFLRSTNHSCCVSGDLKA